VVSALQKPAAEFLFDFASPNAYLAHRVISQIEARTGVKFAYTPVLLGGLFKLTGNQAPMFAFAGIPNKLAYERLELIRFVERHKIPFAMNPHFPINTLHLMRMATAAHMDGGLEPYLEAVFTFMWEKPRKMDDPEVASAALKEAGLDADALFKRAQDGDVKQRLMTTTEEAAKRGAFGIPTFFVGDDIYFGKNTLGEVEEALRARA
jgi:2-hydroxychromene-2-carboxylate isomerase